MAAATAPAAAARAARLDWSSVEPAIFGTLVSSLVALIIATPLAIGVAIFLSEFSPKWLRQPVGFLVDLSRGIRQFVAGTGGTQSGLAYRILESGYQLRIPRMFAALLLISLSGIAIFFLTSWI